MKYTAIAIPSNGKAKQIQKLAAQYWGATYIRGILSIPICWLGEICDKLENICQKIAQELREDEGYEPAWKLYEKYRYFAQMHDTIEPVRIRNIDHNLSLKPHQFLPLKLARMTFHEFGTGLLISDDMGLGKTAESIFIACHENCKTVVVTCPASMVGEWVDEFKKFSTIHQKICAPSQVRKSIVKNQVIIINFEKLVKLAPLIGHDKFAPDLLIVDEIHEFTSRKAKRSKALSHISSVTRKSILLTGTPIANRPSDALFMLSLLDSKFDFNDEYRYWKFFCDYKRGAYGMDHTGASNMRQLSLMLKRCYMIRRLTSQLDYLPENNKVYIDLDAPDELAMKTRKILNKIGKDKLEKADEKEMNRLLKKSRDAEQTRKDIGMIKVPHVVQFVKDLVEQGEPVIVFAFHKEVQMELIRELNNPLHIIGGTPVPERQRIKKRFQEGNDMIIVLSLGAANTGLTLTKARYLVFAEPDYKSAVVKQASKRHHRIGQERDCKTVFIYFKDCLDEYVLRRMENKTNVIDKIIKSE